MESNIVVVSLPMPDMCSLCLKVGAVKNMFLSYGDDNNKEVYSEMLKNCYSIDIAMLELRDRKPLICVSCINKLRAAVRFRRLVEESLNSLQGLAQDIKKEQSDSFVGPNKGSYVIDADDNNDADEDYAADEDVKKEKVDSFADGPSDTSYVHDGDDRNDADEDYVPDEDIKNDIKEESAEEKPKRVKKSHSVLKYIKKQNYSETEMMLESGLFPFKIRKNQLYTCAICSEASSCLDELKTHVMDHNKKNIHKAFKKMLLSNLHRYYKSDTCLRCKVCTTDVRNYEELKSHNDNCSRLKGNKWNRLPFKLEKDQLDCPVCQKTFLNYVNLNTHMNVHYPNYICESCGKAFASKARLRGHMRTHEVGEFPCKYCEAVFDRVTKRENHVSKEHKAGVRYACKRCNITLPSFYARQKHLAEIHDEELKRYKCKVCPQSYITPGHLSSHVRRDHLNERNHKCEQCDLAFYTKNALKMHMIKHDGERIHVCNICQKSYQRKKTLKEHMRIHNNDKRFVCPICGRAFTQKCTLKGHLKVHDRKLDVELTVMETLHSI